MSVRMLAWAWDQRAAPLTKFVLVTLADYANHEGGCFPSIGRLAERTGMSERSVQRAVADLEAEGVLIRKMEKDGRFWFYLNHNLPVVDVPGRSKAKAPDWLRAEVLASGNLTCYWCQERGTDEAGPDGRKWSMDRLKPGRQGGLYQTGNVVLACFSCNAKRGAMAASEFEQKIRGDAESPKQKSGVTPSHQGGDAQSPNGVTHSHTNRKSEPSLTPSEGDLFAAAPIEHPEIPEGLRTPELLAEWGDWKKHRAERRSSLSPTAIKRQVKEMETWGPELAAVAIRHSIAKNYVGLFLPSNQAQKLASQKPGARITKENALRMPSNGA